MARRRHSLLDEHANTESWAIPYGDLVTLLLAFFVVMYATSTANEGKYRVLSDALNAAFAGAPRTIAIANGTLAAAIGLGLRLWIAGLALWLIGHAFAVWAAKRDPHFVEVVRRHVRIPPYLGI